MERLRIRFLVDRGLLEINWFGYGTDLVDVEWRQVRPVVAQGHARCDVAFGFTADFPCHVALTLARKDFLNMARQPVHLSPSLVHVKDPSNLRWVVEDFGMALGFAHILFEVVEPSADRFLRNEFGTLGLL